MSVPAKSRLESAGSITKALTGTCGKTFVPEPLAGVQFGDVRLVVFQTFVTPKPESVMYAVSGLFGSTAARATKTFGTTFVGSRFVKSGDPVVVPQIPPFSWPTSRTLSLAGPIIITLLGTHACCFTVM